MDKVLQNVSLRLSRENHLSVDRFKETFWRMLERSHRAELEVLNTILNKPDLQTPEFMAKGLEYWEGYSNFIQWYIHKHQRNTFERRLETEPDASGWHQDFWIMIGQSNRQELVEVQHVLNYYEVKGAWLDHVEPKDYLFWSGYREFIYRYISFHGKIYKNQTNGISYH